MNRFSSLLLATVLLIIAGISFFLSTRWGIGISPDSITYMKSLNPGIHAPLYSWLLAAIKNAGMTIDTGVKITNFIFFLGTLIITWSVILRTTHSPAASYIGVFFVMTSVQFFSIHTFALSEPLFVFLLYVTLSLLSTYLDRPITGVILAAGLFASATFFTRYAGAPLIASGVICIFLLLNKPFRYQLRSALIFIAASAAPFILWLLTTSRETGREFAFLGNKILERLLNGVDELTRLFMPTQIPFGFRILLLILVVIVASYLIYQYFLQWKKSLEIDRPIVELSSLPLVLCVFILFYLAFLITVIFIQPEMPIYPRFLAPIVPACVIIVIVTVYKVLRPNPRYSIIYKLILVFAVTLAVTNTARLLKRVTHAHETGIGYASRAWKNSDLIKKVHTLDPSAKIYTNAGGVFWLLTTRKSSSIPAHTDPITLKENHNYRQLVTSIADSTRSGKVYIVYFNTVDWRWYLPTLDELGEHIHLIHKENAKDGVILEVIDP